MDKPTPDDEPDRVSIPASDYSRPIFESFRRVGPISSDPTARGAIPVPPAPEIDWNVQLPGRPSLLSWRGTIDVRPGAGTSVVINHPAASVTANTEAPTPAVEAVAAEPQVLVTTTEISWVMTATGFTGWIGSLLAGLPGAVVGGLIGLAWSKRRWNRTRRQP